VEYEQSINPTHPQLTQRMLKVEQLIRQGMESGQWQRTQKSTLVITVVFHNLYHLPSEKISEKQVQAQLKTLNDCFRMRNADTINTRSDLSPILPIVKLNSVWLSQIPVVDPPRALFDIIHRSAHGKWGMT
jgi:hypothetical protein